MKESKKRIMGLFLALAMLITCLPLNPIATYAAEGDVAINNENFPDYYFRDYVSRQLDTNHDTILSQEECDKVANISVVRGYDSLKGIEHFKKLKSLNCSENGLMDTLDLSQNPALEELTCKEIGIKALDLSQNKALKKLNCEGSSWLETLNLGSKPALEELTCYKCPITALDLSQSPRLKNVNCSENQLTELKLGSNSDLETLECSNNQLTELDVRKCPKLTALWFKKNQLRTIDLSNNTALIKLGFGFNKIEKIDLSANTSLEWVGGYNNPLTSLKIPDKTYKNKNFSPITYSVKVQSGGSKVSFFVLPQDFDKNRIQGTVTGASVQGDSFTWDRSTKPITFKYQLCDKPKEVVEAQITVTEGKAIKNTYNLDEMPEDGYERLTFKSGDGNFIGLGKVYAIDVLRGTSYDDLGLKKQIKSIEGDLRPTDKKKEFDKWDKQIPATGNVATETFTAVYKDKDVVKLSNDPISPTPSGYTRIIFDAGDGNTIDGNRYKIIDVLENTRWDDAALRKQIPSKAIYKDASKEFKEWRYEVPTSGKVSRRSFTATYKDGKKVVLPNQENPGEVVKGRVRITFDAGEGNTIDGTHRYKYIDVLEKTNWYETDLKAQIPSMAKYKDASKEFYKWNEQVPTSGRVSTKTFTATYKDGKKVVLPNPTSPGKVVKGRVRITFDAGEGNTIDGTHRYKYIDVLENTPWTNTILIRQIPSKTTSKDTTKEFDKWNEQVPTTGNVETKTFTAIYKEKVFDPANVTSMVVKTQPTKLSYTEGEKLDLAGLEVTLKDNQGLTKDVVFADFTANGITAEPENDTALSVADTGKGIKLTKESLTAETNALIVNIDQAKLAAATTLVEAAENSKAEADYNAAKTAVEALTDSDGKAKLQKRLEEVKKYIDANNAIEALKQKPIADVKEDDISKAEQLINKVKEDWKAPLTQKLEALKTAKTKYDTEKTAQDEADKAVKDLENKKGNVKDQDITNAQEKVDKVTDQQKKGDLQGRLDKVKEDKKKVEATKAVEAAEEAKTQTAYDQAKTKVDALKDGTDKTNLQKRLEEVKKYIDADNAIEALKQKPIADVKEDDINAVQELINKVKEDWRQNLIDDLNIIRTDKKANDQLTEAKNSVAKAEADKTKEAYDNAKAKVDALPNDQNKTDLSGRLGEVDKYIKADDALKDLEGNDIANVTQREIDGAEALINAVKEPWQQGLRDRLATLKTNKAKQVAEDALAQAKTEANQKVESLDKLSPEEKSGYTGRIDQAQNKQEIDSIVLDAEKANAKKKIAGMQNLNDTDRRNADTAVDAANTKAEIDQVVSDAEAKNNSGPKVFDPEHIVSMVVKTQPKLTYTVEEALDLSGLEVTLKDNQEVTKDVAFADFAAYNITTTPANATVLTLADNGKPVALTNGSLQDETQNLTVSANVTPPVPNPPMPNPPVPNPNHPIVDDNDNNNSNEYNRWYIPYWAYSTFTFTPVEISTSEKAETTKKLGTKLVIGSKEIIKSINGTEEKITMDVAPFIKNGRTMLPIRFIAEALGFNVVWDNDQRTVVLIDKENVVKIPVATNKIIVNGKEYESDVKPVLKNNRTMLPIANIARALGLEDGKDIIWDASAKEVIITRKVAK